MKRKVCFAALVMAVILPATAQDTYESARLLGSDLNGTARYVGMGGAMDALGADISTISTNPAGIGLFRHSHVIPMPASVLASSLNRMRRSLITRVRPRSVSIRQDLFIPPD